MVLKKHVKNALDRLVQRCTVAVTNAAEPRLSYELLIADPEARLIVKTLPEPKKVDEVRLHPAY